MSNAIKVYFLSVAAGVCFSVISLRVAAQSTFPVSNFDSLRAVKEIALQSNLYRDAFRKSDSAALGNLYTADAKFLSNGSASVTGRAALIKFFGSMMRSGVTGFSYVTIGVWGSDNNLVVEEGTAVFSLESGKVVSKGRYLLVWKRENGALKIFRDTFAGD
jgi:ketosteroid isomerase-like protein